VSKARNSNEGLSVGIRILSAHLGGGPRLRINPGFGAERSGEARGLGRRRRHQEEELLLLISVAAAEDAAAMAVRAFCCAK